MAMCSAVRLLTFRKFYSDEHGGKRLCKLIKSEIREVGRGIKPCVFELRAKDSISGHTKHEGVEASHRRLKETENSVDELGAEGIGGYNGRKVIETSCDNVKEPKHPVHGSGFILHDHFVIYE